VDYKLILIIVAFVFGLPVGTILAAFIIPGRGRWLALLGAVIGAAATAAVVYWYATTIQVEGLSYALGAFSATTIGAMSGAMVVSFFLSLGERRARSVSPGL
jgi:ABC-type Fe3+-siderophore transport system permease subunit